VATERYEVILQRLDTALNRCSDLGLGEMVNNSRFSQYRRWLEKLIGIVRKTGPTGINHELRDEILKHKAEYLASLVESMEFGEVMQHLSQMDRDVLSSKLVDVLQGPFLPRGENATSNKSRNTLFELNLAALLKRAGFSPELPPHPDVRCCVAQTPLFFECKRPFSGKKVEKRIKEAGKQLENDIRDCGTADTYGVVAISFAKLFSPSQIPIPILNEQIARQFMDSWLMDVAERTKNAWGRFQQSSAIGCILFHLRGIFENAANGRFDVGQWWLGVQFPGPKGLFVKDLSRALTALTD